ncbi:hypothetical protein OBBRIDRAFT_145237 [Obba rivulosa]|uniref:Uncharacterized protein n=1 Tax=Obba rivulosa TaxID=1052685 RepID=A0A8E2DRM9_9APHY|nr:hypothetical protein OBBRIDRAFT_145237 [Obba rivulosa]
MSYICGVSFDGSGDTPQSGPAMNSAWPQGSLPSQAQQLQLEQEYDIDPSQFNVLQGDSMAAALDRRQGALPQDYASYSGQYSGASQNSFSFTGALQEGAAGSTFDNHLLYASGSGSQQVQQPYTNTGNVFGGVSGTLQQTATSLAPAGYQNQRQGYPYRQQTQSRPAANALQPPSLNIPPSTPHQQNLGGAIVPRPAQQMYPMSQMLSPAGPPPSELSGASSSENSPYLPVDQNFDPPQSYGFPATKRHRGLEEGGDFVDSGADVSGEGAWDGEAHEKGDEVRPRT